MIALLPEGRRKMNGLERDYSRLLDAKLLAREIVDWRYQPIKLILAEGNTYTPDFFVVLPNREMEAHETKGFMREDARVKITAAASLYPWFRFALITREKKQWMRRDIPSEGAFADRLRIALT